MLPGFRFLFAAIVLTLSILVFGLGAAALLRAAHEEFAAKPSWRAAPEPTFARTGDAPGPTLAMLRLEPVSVEEKAPDNIPAVAPAEPPAIAAVAAEPDKVAALKPDDASPPEAAKSETPIQETSVPEAAEAAPAPAAEARIAAAEQVLPPAKEAAAPAPETAIVPDTDIAAIKIATLGDPSVAIETQPPSKAAGAKADRSAVKKRLRARRAKERRRLAQRAREAAAQQQAADPFAQPTITTRSR